MKYVIKLNEKGYFGEKPWDEVPRSEAVVFPRMKEARQQLNRLRDRLGYQLSEIEPL